MTKAAVLTLINDLSRGQADATRSGDFYDDVVTALGQKDVIVRAALIETFADVPAYSLPTTAIRREATLYDNRIMDEVKRRDLEVANQQWAQQTGKPSAVWTNDLPDRSFALYPTPEVASGSVAGGDFGPNFPENAITSFHTSFEADLPPWLDLPIAFTVLFYEFERESNHKDVEFAAGCRLVAQLLWGAVGIDIRLREVRRN